MIVKFEPSYPLIWQRNTGGAWIHDFLPISLSISQTIQIWQYYNKIRNHKHFLELCHSRRPWVTFKVISEIHVFLNFGIIIIILIISSQCLRNDNATRLHSSTILADIVVKTLPRRVRGLDHVILTNEQICCYVWTASSPAPRRTRVFVRALQEHLQQRRRARAIAVHVELPRGLQRNPVTGLCP